jgi:CRISPR-associated endonuclease/helicase Cas3
VKPEGIKKLLNTYWAKSDGTTVREHTDRLLENLEVLKTLYGEEIEKKIPEGFRENFWELLRLACEYHDYGKLHCRFQQKVGNKSVKCPRGVEKEVKHNLLSPAFLYHFEGFEEKLFLPALTVFNHHAVPPLVEKEKGAILKVLEKEFGFPTEELEEFSELLEELFTEEYAAVRGYYLENREGAKKTYTLLKGFLLRLDHAGSVKEVSLKVEKPSIDTLKVIEERFELNDLQRFVKENRDKNLLAIASTGYGKSEAGAIFLEKKGFFTLPVRTAINALYRRFSGYFGEENTGLLHSSAAAYLLEETRKENDEYETNKGDGLIKTLFEARHFSQPLIVCTPDQILPFTFHYPGFEKVLSIFSYARLVVDEIQAYEPHTLAFIVQALKEIAAFGGKFLITTATLPAFLREELRELIGAEGVFLTDKVRHHLRFEEGSLLNAIGRIKELSKTSKVLVITNTVERAKEVFKFLKEEKVNANLLHSRFVRKDRQQKERKIEEFFNSDGAGVWITTQLAEASLNVDADYLFTELSTADSLMQRLGRVNRFGRKPTDEPNAFIFTDASGVGTVYPKELLDISLKHLLAFGGGRWDEEKKLKLVEKVYSKETLKGTKYLDRYRQAKNYIESLHQTGLKEGKSFAVEMFRQIMDLTVIPSTFEGEVKKLLENYKSATSYAEKLFWREKIFDYTTGVPFYWQRNNPQAFYSIPELQKWGIKLVKAPYGEELGLEKPPQVESDEFNNLI